MTDHTSDHDQSIDPRHTRRVQLVQSLYTYAYGMPRVDDEIPSEIAAETHTIVDHLPQIDALIQTHAPKYPLDQVARADLAILRLAVYELTVVAREPQKVIINEAIELAKEMGSDKAYAFVNAVLGAIVNKHVIETGS